MVARERLKRQQSARAVVIKGEHTANRTYCLIKITLNIYGRGEEAIQLYAKRSRNRRFTIHGNYDLIFVFY